MSHQLLPSITPGVSMTEKLTFMQPNHPVLGSTSTEQTFANIGNQHHQFSGSMNIGVSRENCHSTTAGKSKQFTGNSFVVQ